MTIVDYAISGNFDMLRRVAKETDVNKVSLYDGKGVLHWAARRGHIEMMHFWISLPECNVSLQSSDGNTPLHDCVMATYNFPDPFQEIRLQLITMLFKAGADVTIRNQNGYTPLSLDLPNLVRNHMIDIISEEYDRIETFFSCALHVMSEREVDQEMEDFGYEYEDMETSPLGDLVKNVKEDYILAKIFEYII